MSKDDIFVTSQLYRNMDYLISQQNDKLFDLRIENHKLRERIKELEECAQAKDAQIADLRADIEALC